MDENDAIEIEPMLHDSSILIGEDEDLSGPLIIRQGAHNLYNVDDGILYESFVYKIWWPWCI